MKGETQDPYEVTYLDSLREILINYCEENMGKLPNERDLEVPRLKELHSKMWEHGSPDSKIQDMIDDWNLRVPTIPWDMG